MIGRKGQGSLEYLIIIAAVLAIAAVVVLFLSGILGGSQAAFSECRLKASECAGMQIAGPFNCYNMCAAACTGNNDQDIITGEGAAVACAEDQESACGYCMVGDVGSIQPGNGGNGGNGGAVFFSEDFEGTNGQALDDYDSNWIVESTGSAYTAEIDTSHSQSGSASLRLSATGNTGRVDATRDVGDFSSKSLTLWWRMNLINYAPVQSNIYTYSDDGQRYALLTFGGSASSWKIRYYDGSTWMDPGLNYAQDTWYKITITQDTAQGTWSAWIDGGSHSNVKIADNANRREAGNSNVEKINFRAYDAWSIHYAEHWIDNVVIQ